MQHAILKNGGRRVLAVLLAAALLLSLAACGSTESSTADETAETAGTDAETTAESGQTGTASAEASDAEAEGTGYTTDYMDLDADITYVSGTVVFDGQLYLPGGRYDDTTYTYYNMLLLLDETGAVTGEISIPDTDSSSIYTLCPAPDGVMALTYVYELQDETDVEAADTDDTEWDYGETETYEEYYAIELYSTDGELLSSMHVPEDESLDYFYVEDLAVGPDGTIYYYMDATLYVCDSELNQLYTVEVPAWIYDLLLSPDGQLLVCYYDEDWNDAIAFLDAEQQALGDPLELGLNSDLYSFSYGFGLDGSLYAWTENDLYYCDLDEETAVPVCSWLDWDVDGNNLTGVIGLESGDLMLLGYDSWTGDLQVVLMTEVPASELPEKIEITYGTAYLDYDLRQAILTWNRQNDTYHISVVDYSDSTTDSSGYTQFERDILSGDVPDILDGESLDMTALRRDGLLVDLYTLMGEDTYTADDFVQGYLTAEESTDGCLYTISPIFRVITLLGASEYVGTEQGWSLEDFIAAAAAFPETGDIWEDMTPDSFLLWVLECAFDSFVDLDTATCSFDSEEFIELLEAAAIFPEEYDDSESSWVLDDDYYTSQYNLLLNGEEMLQTWAIYYLDDLRSSKALALDSDDLTLVGVPGTGGNGAYIVTYYAFSITTTCENQAAAWDFLCSLMDEDFLEEYIFGLPVLRDVLDGMLEEAMTPAYYTDEDGNLVENEDYPALTQAQADAVVSLVENAAGKYYYDEAIEEIVLDAAAAYFAGSKSAEAVAASIQDRVQTYLDEQYS